MRLGSCFGTLDRTSTMLAIKKKKDQIYGEEKKRENDARIRAKINVARSLFKKHVGKAYNLIKKGG